MVNESERWNRVRKNEEAQEIVKQFLLSRESDIALSMEDFGSLEYAFEILIGRKAKEGKINKPIEKPDAVERNKEQEREKIKHINEIKIQSLINERVEIARKDERLKWKLKIGELRNDLYDGLPVGEIKDAFEMIKLTNKHMKELDKLVEGEKLE